MKIANYGRFCYTIIKVNSETVACENFKWLCWNLRKESKGAWPCTWYQLTKFENHKD